MGSPGLQYSVSPLLIVAVALITMCPVWALIRLLLAAQLIWGLSSTPTWPVALTIASSPLDLFPQSTEGTPGAQKPNWQAHFLPVGWLKGTIRLAITSLSRSRVGEPFLYFQPPLPPAQTISMKPCILCKEA